MWVLFSGVSGIAEAMAAAGCGAAGGKSASWSAL